MTIKTGILATAGSAGLLIAAFAAAAPTVVTFDNGAEGWDGNAAVEPDGGHPGANAHFLLETTGIEYRTDSNTSFVGDFTSSALVNVGLDVKVDSITYDGGEISRNLLVEFRSHALAQGGYPYASVWTRLGVLQASPDWATYTVSFAPAAQAMPAGWGGFGAEDPTTGDPMLPPGVSFADVMAHVDELAFTTFEPGYIYGFAVFDARMDNLSIERLGDRIFSDGFDPAPVH